MLSESIHPRVLYPADKSQKKNTCAPRSIKRFLNQIAGMERHLENNPNDVACRARLETAKRRAAP